MLRAIYFLDCDFCHESLPDIRSMTDTDQTNWSYIRGDLEESAFDDGWCHCLIDDTGEYKIMCGACHSEQSLTAEQVADYEDIEF